MKHKVIQIDTRGVAMDIAMRISSEPYIRDLTTVSYFMDSQYQSICEIITKFWQAQVSSQRACTVNEVQAMISRLIDGAFCRTETMLSAPQLQSMKTAFFQALVSGYFSRGEVSTEAWDRVDISRLNMDTYVLQCDQIGGGIFTREPSMVSMFRMQ